MRREFGLWIAEGGFGFAVAGDEAQVGAPEQISEWHAPGWAIRFHKDPALCECEFVWLALLERRAWRCGCEREQRRDCVVSRCEDGWDYRAGGHGAAGNRAGR